MRITSRTPPIVCDLALGALEAFLIAIRDRHEGSEENLGLVDKRCQRTGFSLIARLESIASIRGESGS